jgi:hypothetical protein
MNLEENYDDCSSIDDSDYSNGDDSASEWSDDEENGSEVEQANLVDENCTDNATAIWLTCRPDQPTTEYTHPEFIEKSGPSDTAKKCKTALQFFLLFLTPALMKNLVNGTNNYANQKLSYRKEEKLQQAHLQPATRANAKVKQDIEAKHESSINWYDTDYEEMKAFIGINLYMGILKLPSTSDYFSNLYRQSIVVQTFTRDRFRQLQSNWHCDDSTSKNNNNALRQQEDAKDNDDDALSKIRPLITGVLKSFQIHFTPSQHLTVDETMIGFNGRVKFKQHVKRKPVKSGYKVWALADATYRYLLNFQIYTAKQRNSHSTNNNLDEKSETINHLSYNVVTDLTRSYVNKNHVVYTDSFYTSIKLSQDLRKVGIYTCGTMLPNRREFPAENLLGSMVRPIQWGQHHSLYHSVDKNMIATIWKDKKWVYLLSNFYDPHKVTHVLRKAKGEGKRVDIQCPEAVSEYQKYMRGVDVIDQLHSYYAPGRKSRKWWTCLVWWMINVCVLNAYSVARQIFPNKYKRQRQFREELISQLIGNFTRRNASTSFVNHPAVSFFTNQGKINAPHWVGKLESGISRSCEYCRRNKKAKNIKCNSGAGSIKKRIPRSVYKCENCNVVLCLFPCFKQYHLQRADQLNEQQCNEDE